MRKIPIRQGHVLGIGGTPGTGKSLVASILRERGLDVVDLNSLSERFRTSYDDERGSWEVDMDALLDALHEIDGHETGGVVLVEGHLAPYLVDAVLVLRCNPAILRERLVNRGYSDRKVEENILAEILDSQIIEATERGIRTYEVDATELSPEEVADIVIELLEHETTCVLGGENSVCPHQKLLEKLKVGRVDWTGLL